MAGDLVTRRVLARELAVNAATRPLNLAVPSGVVVAGFLLGTVWLLPVAVLVYVAMAIATFFDGDEAERVGRAIYDRMRPQSQPELEVSHLAPEIAAKLERARAEAERIGGAVDDGSIPRADVGEEVARLMAGLDQLAARAQQIYAYLDDQDLLGVSERLRALRGATSGDAAVDRANAEAAAALEEQLAVTRELERHLARFDAQMEHAIASLGAIHGQIVRMNATEEAVAQRNVAADVRSLRREVNVTADALGELYDDEAVV